MTTVDDLAKHLEADEWGRVVLDYDTALEVLMSGESLDLLDLANSPALAQYNEMCIRFDKRDEMFAPTAEITKTPEEYHHARSQEWLLESAKAPFWDELLLKCQSDEERNRFVEELQLFDDRKMIPMLERLHVLITKIDDAGVVRGVGRGSSVASFILFLMGVHFINPLTYDLDISEFLK